MTDVSVVVVTYNAGEWVRRCLARLQSYVSDLSLQTIIVDNASTEFDEAQLREWAGPGAVVHRQSQNVGFGRGCNRGVSMADGDYVLLLNPDADISPGSIEALVEMHRSQTTIGIVGGRITSPSGELDRGSCWGFQSTWSLVCFALGLSTVFSRSMLWNPEGLGAWARDTARRVDVVTGCLLLIHRELWDTLGGFAPRYFMYGEDADLCRRAAQLGWHSWVTPDAHIVHALGASSETTLRKQVLLFRGKATLALTESNPLTSRFQVLLLQVGVGIRAAGERLSGHNRAAWLGLWRARNEWRSGWPELPAMNEVGRV